MKDHSDATDNTEDSHIERQIEDSVFSDTAQWPCYYSFIKDIQMIFCTVIGLHKLIHVLWGDDMKGNIGIGGAEGYGTAGAGFVGVPFELVG